MALKLSHEVAKQDDGSRWVGVGGVLMLGNICLIRSLSRRTRKNARNAASCALRQKILGDP